MTDIAPTIVMTEESLHRLILTAGEVAYDRCRSGQAWEKTRIELIDALVGVTHTMSDEEQRQLGV